MAASFLGTDPASLNEIMNAIEDVGSELSPKPKKKKKVTPPPPAPKKTPKPKP